MKLYVLAVLFFINFSCMQSSKNIEDNAVEIAEKLNTIYFANELPSFVLYSENMKKEKKTTALNLEHDTYCLDNSAFFQDTIFKSLDTIFLNLNDPILTEICFFSNGVSLDYYDKKGDLKFQLNADSAIQYIDKDFIKLKNHVILSTPTKKTLMTNSLFWDVSSETVWTYDSIIIKNMDTIQGRGCGLFSKDNFQNYKTYGVKGQINLLD